MTSDNATSICNFSVGEALRAFLISSINCSRSTESRDVRVVSYLDSTPTLDLSFCFRYGLRAPNTRTRARQRDGESRPILPGVHTPAIDADLFRAGRALDRALIADSAACRRRLAIDAQLFFEHLSRLGAQRKLLNVCHRLTAYSARHGDCPFSRCVSLSSKTTLAYDTAPCTLE